MKYSGILLFCIVFISCGTFKTYYGITETDIDSGDKKTLRLNLSHRGLKSIPSEVLEMKSLRYLNLTGNYNINLEGLDQLKELRVLVLDSTGLVKTGDLKGLENLEQLSCRKNVNLNLELLFNNLLKTKIKRIDISSNNLIYLPGNVAQIQTIVGIKLSNNHLNSADVYKSLAKMENLKSIWLDNNQIVTLAEEIGLLNQVEYLYLDNNQIMELPVEMRNLKCLKVLHMYNNLFNELPVELIDMPALLFAILSENDIKSIPNIFFTHKLKMLAFVLTGNPLKLEDKVRARKAFKNFFLLEM